MIQDVALRQAREPQRANRRIYLLMSQDAVVAKLQHPQAKKKRRLS